MNPQRKPASNQNREWLELISSHESRQRGGLHMQHFAGHHSDRWNPRCDLCKPKGGNEKKD